jgi:hypothetical protein
MMLIETPGTDIDDMSMGDVAHWNSSSAWEMLIEILADAVVGWETLSGMFDGKLIDTSGKLSASSSVASVGGAVPTAHNSSSMGTFSSRGGGESEDSTAPVASELASTGLAGTK